MTSRTRPTRIRPRVIFKHNKRNMTASMERDMSAMDIDAPDEVDVFAQMSLGLFTSYEAIPGGMETDSSRIQQATVEECLPFLTGKAHKNLNDYGVLALGRDRHIRFLRKQLGNLPAVYVGADPTRPWIFYWCLAGLSLLGEDVQEYRTRLVETVRPMQNLTGGFGGGHGQISHLATSYATILSLALVGGEEAYQVVDRLSMWKWLSLLKQKDGGFQMAVGGEEDVRGAYCAAVLVSLLKLPLELSPESPAFEAGHAGLFSGLGDWVRQCQTFEGGMSAKPGIEAHGAYAFCALGCLSIIDTPHKSFERYLDVPRLISWLSSRQYAPEGGFSGRTNKLVDGCYSHWVGGCWPLIAASLSGPEGSNTPSPADDMLKDAEVDSTLFSRNGLIRYILCCCQDTTKRGGLRDKPSKYSDAYHSCYVLSGLSSVQHKWRLIAARADEAILDGDKWESDIYKGEQIFGEEDMLAATHPVYAIPPKNVEDIQAYFDGNSFF